MKTILISVALAAAVSVSITQWMTRRPPIHLHDVAWLRRELGLTAEQEARIVTLTEQYRSQLNAGCVKHCDARFALSEELAKPSVNLSAAETAVGQMCAAANEVEYATLQHIVRVREVLTPDQRVRYAALIHQQLCNMHPPVQP